MQLAHFQAALKNLGSDNDERATALGVSERTLRLWRAKEPRIIHIIVRHPDLVRALVEDAQHLGEPLKNVT